MKIARLLALVFLYFGAAVVIAQHPLPQVAFTFDDLPAHGPLPPGEFRPEPIRTILKTLKTEHMPPVYGFVNGFRTARYPYQEDLLREWIASGNPLGNHTWSHPPLDQTSARKFIANIAKLTLTGTGTGFAIRIWRRAIRLRSALLCGIIFWLIITRLPRSRSISRTRFGMNRTRAAWPGTMTQRLRRSSTAI